MGEFCFITIIRIERNFLLMMDSLVENNVRMPMPIFMDSPFFVGIIISIPSVLSAVSVMVSPVVRVVTVFFVVHLLVAPITVAPTFSKLAVVMLRPFSKFRMVWTKLHVNVITRMRWFVPFPVFIVVCRPTSTIVLIGIRTWAVVMMLSISGVDASAPSVVGPIYRAIEIFGSGIGPVLPGCEYGAK